VPSTLCKEKKLVQAVYNDIHMVIHQLSGLKSKYLKIVQPYIININSPGRFFVFYQNMAFILKGDKIGRKKRFKYEKA
jgi:hypothetical protein